LDGKQTSRGNYNNIHSVSKFYDCLSWKTVQIIRRLNMNTKLFLRSVKTIFILMIICMVASVGIFSPQPVAAQEAGPAILPEDVTAQANQVATLPTDQIIIRYKASATDIHPDGGDQLQQLSNAAGVSLAYGRAMSDEAHVLLLPQKMTLDQVQTIATQLSALPDVEYAEPDAIKYHTGMKLAPTMLTPNDPQLGNQWSFTNAWGIDAPTAWDITTGDSSIVVAVLDTGITSHSEFTGRTVAGYDFINNLQVANDGNLRDNNPSDPGDWITTAESNGSAAGGFFAGCTVSNSSWHGTHVGGTIGATGNNGVGVAGINWVSKIQPVRVLGKCGGYTSDIADAIRWAAGGAVAGVPANATPADVINLSLGGGGSCGAATQSAISYAVSAGSVVVVSAGNSATNASGFSPANCNGVITVSSSGPAGDLAYYSNYGAVVEITAQGGEMSFAGDPNGILSTLNAGLTSPGAANYVYYQGTSMAAPHVSGVVSLMFSINPNLTPAQVLQMLQSSVKAFPGGGSCTTAICGSGILDADAALVKAMTTSTFYSNAALDGWLVESSENSNVGGGLSNAGNLLLVGDTASNQQYRSVMSFGTASLPDTAVIYKVTLKLKQQGVVGGGNPVTAFNGFTTRIKNGFFGTLAGMQTPDFQDATGQSYGPFSPSLSGGSYAINLTSGKAHINKLAANNGVTQIRLGFTLDDNNNSIANYLSLYSGDHATAANRPQLIVTYYVP
jgi:serine protease